jgi:hypothetical protein
MTDRAPTLFAAAIRLCGLSQREAAAFFIVPIDTLKSWANGRRSVPPGVWTELRGLYRQQQRAAKEALALIDEQRPAALTLALGGQRARQWPSPGAAAAADAMVALSCDVPIVRLD